MTVRTETLLNLAIVLIIAVDAFVAMQVFQQRAIAADSLPAITSTTPTTVAAATGDTPEDDPVSPVTITAGVEARNELQSAVLASQLFFVEQATMPADSFALQSRVPGPRFVDGVGRAGVGVIGIERTDTTILFVSAETEERWICASVDGPAQVTQYGTGATRDAIDDLASCRGSQEGWG